MISWQTHGFKPWLRTVALLTVCVFTFTSVVWDGGINKAYAAAPKPESLTPVEAFKAHAVSSLIDRPDLPDSYGTVKGTFKGNREQIILHIQDAHINEEAQRNIANILRYFSEKYQLGLVSLEGASGELYTELFSFFPDKEARRNVADYFLKEGRLTGPEYLAIVEKPAMTLYGVEDKDLYEENRAAYVDALQFKDRDEKILAELGKVLEGVSRFVFPEEMRELVRRRAAFQEGGPELVAYVRYLVELARKHNVALDDYPGMHSLLELVDLEKQIDFEKAEKETDGMINDMKRVLSREKLSRFLTNTVHFRMKKMKRAAYYGYLQDEIRGMSVVQTGGEDLTAKYANVLAYIKYMKLYDAIDVSIFDEIEFLEKTVKNKLFSSPEQVKLDHVLRIYDIYCKMFDFSLTKQDAEFYYTFQDEFKTSTFSSFLKPLMTQYHFTYGLPSQVEYLDQDLPRVERFYKAALERDQVLIERAVEKTLASGQKISAIITGGFHTPGIEKYLREKDLSYIVVAPRITKAINKEKESALYDAALRETPLPIEKVLSEAFLQPKTGVLNDPRFQLAAKLATPTRNEIRVGGAELATARAEVRLSTIETIFMETDPQIALAKIRTAMQSLDPDARNFIDSQIRIYDGAYRDGNKLWLLGGGRIGAIVRASASAKRGEVAVAGARTGTSILMPGGYQFVVYENVSEIAVPDQVLKAHRAAVAREEIAPGLQVEVGKISADVSLSAQQAQLEEKRLKKMRENLEDLKEYLGDENIAPDGFSIDATEDLTSEQAAFRRLLRNSNFGSLENRDGKIGALLAIDAKNTLTRDIILHLLLRSSPKAIGEIPSKLSLFRRAGIEPNVVTITFTEERIKQLIADRQAEDVAAEAAKTMLLREAQALSLVNRNNREEVYRLSVAQLKDRLDLLVLYSGEKSISSLLEALGIEFSEALRLSANEMDQNADWRQVVNGRILEGLKSEFQLTSDEES
jgi:hypothetical protein